MDDIIDNQHVEIELLNDAPKNYSKERWEIIVEQSTKSSFWMFCFVMSMIIGILLSLFWINQIDIQEQEIQRLQIELKEAKK